MGSKRSKYVLLDRDGVINRRIPNGYVASWSEFEFLPRVAEAIRLLTTNHYETLVISNQACVGKGLMTRAALETITRRFVRHLEARGGRIVGVYYCPHRKEDHCACRKPQPGLLLRAQREHGFAFAETYMIGDSDSDLLAANRVACPALLIAEGAANNSEPWAIPPQGIFPGLLEAVRFILGGRDGRRARDVPGRKRMP